MQISPGEFLPSVPSLRQCRQTGTAAASRAAANDVINWLWWLLTYILPRVSLSLEGGGEIDANPCSALPLGLPGSSPLGLTGPHGEGPQVLSTSEAASGQHRVGGDRGGGGTK